MKPENCSPFSGSQPGDYIGHSSCGNNRIRVIRLRRHSNIPLGFSVRGGREHGTGIFVSEVRPGSEAHHQGLLVGDQIIRINGFNIEQAVHDEVLALLKAKPGVVIKVKSMGMIPVKDAKKDPLTWKIVDPNVPDSTSDKRNSKSIGSSSNNDCIETQITISTNGVSGLGCSIVKGPPDIPGIYIQSVKKGSLAEQAGLQVGDKIIKMNGHNFTSLDFSDAVSILKSSKQMHLVLHKGIGLDLFPEEKQKRQVPQSAFSHEDKTKTSAHDEETRDIKKMNGQSTKVTYGSSHYNNAFLEKDLNNNGQSPSSETSSLITDVSQDVQMALSNHNIKVHATVHMVPCEEGGKYILGNCTRESGDGMEFDSRDHHAQTNCHLWDDDCQGKDLRKNVNEDESSNHHSMGSSASTEGESSGREKSSNSDSEKPDILNFSELIRQKCDFFSEARRHGDKSSVTSDEKSERSSLSSDDYLGGPRAYGKTECKRPENEFLKRKQHELLMEEFREVHKKMFGQCPQKAPRRPKAYPKEDEGYPNQYQRRQQVRNNKVVPPPPPPLPDLLSMEKSSKDDIFLHDGIDNETDSEQVMYRRRQREPPITDSRGPEPKPPQTYFDKPESGQRPLVTIGAYPNNAQQNRFLSPNAAKFGSHQIQHKRTCEPTTAKGNEQCSNLHEMKNGVQSSENTAAPSSMSSEPRSPTRESSGEGFFNVNNQAACRERLHLETDATSTKRDQDMPNNFQVNLSKFCKTEEECKTQVIFSRSSKGKLEIPIKCNTKIPDNGPHIEFPEDETDGKEVKTITLKKNGPLNFRIEGGINSPLSGKIVVSEVWEGSCVLQGGQIELGDQILKVDNTKFTGLSLTAANVALRNANSNSNKEMVLVIAKATSRL